jgi:hypothetical protein
MKTILRWTLSPGSTDLHMPAGAKVLTVQMQGDSPQLWALVDAETPREWRAFDVYGTGNPLPDNPGMYVATFQRHGTDLAWHVFEALRADA